ncbi:hypothetical protein DL767_010765 [Monosporascus sp. MG133]|nr:hypothetical protein DL767_010765 [Monosporascus sp. MG133]
MPDLSSIPPEQLDALFARPAFPAPNGIVSNFDNPSNNNALGVGVAVTCLTLATLCAFMRAVSRLVCVKKIQIEDYLGVIAYAFYVACVWTVLEISRTIGLFVHQWDIRATDLVHYAYVSWI